MSTLVDYSIISREQFNRITNIADQEQLHPDYVTGIREIFRAHNVVHQLGLQLLHSHYELPPGSIALTVKLDADLLVTKITPRLAVSEDNLHGQLYFLNKEHRFQAYEYEYGQPVNLPTPFLQDLAKFIIENGIEKQVAIATSSPEAPNTEITLGSNATATLFGKKAVAKAKELGGPTMIGWKF